MRRRHQPEFARHPDIVFDHLPGAPIRAEDRHRQRDAAVIAGEPPLAQCLDPIARMRHMGERHAAFLGRRLRRAMGEHRANAAVDQAVDGALGHLEAGDVVAPVDQRGDAGIDLRQRAEQIAEVIVFGIVAGGEIEMHVPQVIRRRPFDADPAQRGFPCVHMRVDQTRHHDLVGGVDGFVSGGVQIFADRFDAIALKEDFAALEVADRRIERDQPAAFDQNAFHHFHSMLERVRRSAFRGSAPARPATGSRVRRPTSRACRARRCRPASR